MKDFSQKKSWKPGVLQTNVEPPPTHLIKSKLNFKTERDYVNIKLRINPTSERLDIYELKMALLENGDLEELLFFMWN